MGSRASRTSCKGARSAWAATSNVSPLLDSLIASPMVTVLLEPPLTLDSHEGCLAKLQHEQSTHTSRHTWHARRAFERGGLRGDGNSTLCARITSHKRQERPLPNKSKR